MIGRLKCWLHGEHDYYRSERIEMYTLRTEDKDAGRNEIAAQCVRCRDVVWISEVFDE